MLNNVPTIDMDLKENDLTSFICSLCPQCLSRNVVKNGTCLRKMENGIRFGVQRYICRDCRHSFLASLPNDGYEKHYPGHVEGNNVKTGVKTSPRKAADMFRIIVNVIMSH